MVMDIGKWYEIYVANGRDKWERLCGRDLGERLCGGDK